MIKVVTCLRRRAGMPVDEFQTYWRTTHARVVPSLPRLRRYVQSHTLVSGYGQGQPVWDGIAEVWFDDTQAVRALQPTQEYAAVRADEANFIDRATMVTIITEDHLIKDGPVPPVGVKNVEFLTRQPGMAVGAFQRYWREVHGPLGAAIPMVLRYVQSHTRRSIYEAGRTPAYDGFAITWFDDTRAMRASAQTPEYARVRADEANFIAPGQAPFIITREHVIVP